MDNFNMWNEMPSNTTTEGEVQYTPCIDLSHGYDGQQGEGFQASFENLMQPSFQNTMQATSNMVSANANNGAPSGSRRKATTQKPAGGGSSRSENYTNMEDETLCSAYLNISKDPIVGVNQPMKSYWARITEYYNEVKRTPTYRNSKSLQHRWSDIQKDVSRFCAFYDQIVRRNQSGKSEDDKIKDALQLYQGSLGHSFKFLHCWLILRNEMKWCDWLAQLQAKQSKQQEQPPTEVVTAEAASEQSDSPKFERPMGRDRTKKHRTSSSSSSSSAYLEVLQKMSLDRAKYDEHMEAATVAESKEVASRSERKLALQERQVHIQEEILKLQKEEKDEKLMLLDADKFNPWVRDYIIFKQKEIAAKTVSGEGGPSGPSSS